MGGFGHSVPPFLLSTFYFEDLMKPPELIELLKKLPQEKSILCQVVDQSSHAFNCQFEFNDIEKSWMIQLRVFHEQLVDLYNLEKP
jgi:hypothetical protein